VFYQLKVDLLVAAVIFSAAGLIILALFAWFELKAYAAAQFRIYKRLASFANPFANPIAISRTFSRSEVREPLMPHKIQ
jgi:hypothetical protein